MCNQKYVWYATYGSNLLYERFKVYILGGTFRLHTKIYWPCRDQALPVCNLPFVISHEMYFGNHSPSWNQGGVSFLDTSKSGLALGRMYKITTQQFDDVWCQEGRGLDWYYDIVCLGQRDGCDILTMTNNKRRPVFAPDPDYTGVIKEGIKETYPEKTDAEIAAYLTACGA